ncbi:MAG TPA: serine hydrolase, partial [Bacillota bacterium]|nr:serine hydrolase [Bacillota bacterium]
LKHSLNSGTKSVISALVGIAIHEGLIKSIDDKVLGYFPDMKIANNDERKQNLRIRDLLTMSTGMNWEFTNNLSTNQMLQAQNWTKFVLDQPMKEASGQNFNYCNGATQLLSAIIQKTSGKSAGEFAEEKLPLGIKDKYWSFSPEKVNSGYSGLYGLPTDMAKFGYLYLKKGRWNDRRLVPETWIRESTKAQISANWTSIFPKYGYLWWMNRFGGYCALGYGGQYIFVIPESELVVVFTGGLFTDTFFPGEVMEKYILPAIKAKDSLKPNPVGMASLHQAINLVQNAPQPKPVPPLPKIAKSISGRTFVIEESLNIRLTFDGSREAKFEEWPKYYSYRIGMDDVFRINDIGDAGALPDHNHGAYKGRWLDESTFQGIGRNLEEGFETIYTIHFDKDQVEMTMTSNVSSGETRLKGKLKQEP